VRINLEFADGFWGKASCPNEIFLENKWGNFQTKNSLRIKGGKRMPPLTRLCSQIQSTLRSVQIWLHQIASRPYRD